MEKIESILLTRKNNTPPNKVKKRKKRNIFAGKSRLHFEISFQKQSAISMKKGSNRNRFKLAGHDSLSK